MSIGERFKRVIDSQEMKISEASDLVGLPYRTLQNYLRGEREPKASALEGFVTQMGVSAEWLITGEGCIFKKNTGAVVSYEDPDYSEIPLYDVEASAGGGSLFDNEPILSYLKFRNDWMIREGVSQKDLVAIRVTGDSMDSTLADGDTVLIDRSRTRPDGVFAVRIGDGLRIKRLQQLVDGSLRVSSDNDVYADETIPKENLEQVEIIGFCHWRGGRVF